MLARVLTRADRCDAACPAAAVGVVNTPSGGELLFCGHHMSKHAPAAAEQGCDVFFVEDVMPGRE